MKRPDETQTQFAIRLLVENDRDKVVKLIDGQLQSFEGSEEQIAAVEEFTGNVIKAIKEMP